MKRNVLLIAGLLLLALLVAACGGGTTETAPTAEPAEPTAAPAEPTEAAAEESTDGLRIGLVTDVGRVDDKSFNQSAWEGAQQAAEALGATEVNYIETTSATDYMANISLFAEDGYNIIVTVGFAMGEATLEAAELYPDIDFIAVDQFQGSPLPNVTGLIFNEDKAGYLAGVLAASLSESGTIASVLGTNLVPPVVAFNEGYLNGARSVNPDINIIDTYHPGGLDVAFTDPEWGATTAQQAIDQGADVIFGAGGQTGNGALIQTAGNPGLWCIGVDTDQWETVPEAHACLVSSAMKLITPGVVDLATASAEGAFPGGNFFGDVGLAPFHDHADAVPQDVQDLLEETNAGLLDGSISTGYGSAPAEEEGASSDLRIGLVTDVGRVDDKSFNQSAWEGAQQAAESLGAAEVNYIETTSATDYMANIALFAEDGYNIIVTVGFAMGEATLEAAALYPDIDFIAVDQFQGSPLPNVTGLIFNEDKAGYLAGVLAASLSESGTVASVLGTNLVPPVVAFNEGYLNGARSVNPDINIIDTYHPGGLDVAFTDPEWGATTAQQAIDQGADVIFGAGGQTGNGALIQTAGNPGLWCIGVDTDQWETVPEAHACLVSSAMKLIAPGVVYLATASAEGAFPGGNFFGDVGLASFHDHADAVPQDVQDLLEETNAGLLDGSISTGYGD